MTTPTAVAAETQETIAAIARMLRHAAGRTNRQAEQQGPRSPLHLLSLGLHVAAAEAAQLVPPRLDPYWPPPAQDDTIELLRAADQLAATVPIDQGAAVGFCRLEVMIVDLLREANLYEADA